MADQIIQCPFCQGQLSISEELIGREVHCPLCQQTLIAASGGGSSPAENDFIPPPPMENNFTPPPPMRNNFTPPPPMGNNFTPPPPMRNNFTPPPSQSCDKAFIQDRKILRNFFAGIVAENKASGIGELLSGTFSVLFDIIFFAFTIFKRFSPNCDSQKILQAFKNIKNYDAFFLDRINVLPRYGKNEQSLVAPVQTLYEPAVSDYDDDNVVFKYENIDIGNFTYYVYSTEAISKIYTFEDQLLVYNGLWDYCTGSIIHEESNAFFFKDITDVSTETTYEEVETPLSFREVKNAFAKDFLFLNIIFGFLTLCVATIFIALGDDGDLEAKFSIPISIGISLLIWALAIYIFYLLHRNNSIYCRESETLTITASSGNSISITMLCDEWLNASKTSFIGKRSKAETIFNAIRKMIEEKKVDSNE